METLNKTEQEAIILYAICELIDEMVSRDMFAKEWNPNWNNILFRSSKHAKLFNIILVDFLSIPKKHKGKVPFDLTLPLQTSPGYDQTYLFFLKEILDNPQFSSENAKLRNVVCEFSKWLAGDTVINNAWFPSLDLNIDIRVNRCEALKITGDICKHNFTRLSVRAKSLQRIFSENGAEKNLEDCYVALPEFEELFHQHAFVYQSSQIAEFLNRLRWAIHEYLEPEYRRAYCPNHNKHLNIQSYSFDVPDQIETKLARTFYWELMNLVRGGPNIPEFSVSISMKSQLS